MKMTEVGFLKQMTQEGFLKQMTEGGFLKMMTLGFQGESDTQRRLGVRRLWRDSAKLQKLLRVSLERRLKSLVEVERRESVREFEGEW